MKTHIASKGFSYSNITAVPMGIDVDDYRQSLNNLFFDVPKHSDSLVYVGSMEKIRKIDFLLRVFQKVLYEIPTAKLFLIGGSSNDQDIDNLLSEAKSMQIDHAVICTGNLPRSKALKYIMAADIGLSPIVPNPVFMYSSPTKILEYMLMEKPVVANVIPDQKKIIGESKAGYCVKYDETDFAKAIITILTNPELAKIMGKNGIDYVMNKRNYKNIANIVDEQYRKHFS